MRHLRLLDSTSVSHNVFPDFEQISSFFDPDLYLHINIDAKRIETASNLHQDENLICEFKD